MRGKKSFRYRLFRAAIREGSSAAVSMIRSRPGVDWRTLAAMQQGAKRYLEAIVSGDEAPNSLFEERIGICLQCPSMTEPTVMRKYCAVSVDRRELPGYCGPKFQSRTDEDPPTCGCPVRAKAMVASESCPQGKW